MTVKLGDTAPDFEAETTEGRIRFHEWIGDSWAVLFSHPRDFTPVCTTELGYMAKVKPEFDRRNTKIIGLSVDPVDNHAKWSQDIEETQGTAPNYPMIGDADFAVSKAYGMLPADVSGDPTERTPAMNQTVRNVFVIGPDKKVKLILVYPMTTGRNFDEVLRVIDSLQLTANHKVSTPVNWQQGEDVIIAGSVSDDQAREIWPDGWESPRPYIRIVPQPNITTSNRIYRVVSSRTPASRNSRATSSGRPSSVTMTSRSCAAGDRDERRAPELRRVDEADRLGRRLAGGVEHVGERPARGGEPGIEREAGRRDERGVEVQAGG